MSSEIVEQYRTEWTQDRRYRLLVQRWPALLVLACETECALLPKGEKYAHRLSEVALPTANLRHDTERFAEHAFRFYSDELAALAVDAVRKVFDGLQEQAPDADASTPVPPRGSMN